ERGALTFSSSDFHLELAADSLRCLGSRRRNGQVDRIDSADAQEIERRICDEVFACSTYPSITASGKLPEISPAGEISLEIGVEMRGIRQTLHHASQTPIKKLCIDIKPSRWGIAPIRALAGTLRLEDRVTIELNLETP